MGTIETSGFITVAKLAGIRAMYGSRSATEQSIHTQIRQVEGKLKTPEQVGFNIERWGSAVMVKILDPDLKAFASKLDKFVATLKK